MKVYLVLVRSTYVIGRGLLSFFPLSTWAELVAPPPQSSEYGAAKTHETTDFYMQMVIFRDAFGEITVISQFGVLLGELETVVDYEYIIWM